VKTFEEALQEVVDVFVKNGWSKGTEKSYITVEHEASHIQLLLSKKNVFYRWVSGEAENTKVLPVTPATDLRTVTAEHYYDHIMMLLPKMVKQYKLLVLPKRLPLRRT
jgi:hypothetical protein